MFYKKLLELISYWAGCLVAGALVLLVISMCLSLAIWIIGSVIGAIFFI